MELDMDYSQWIYTSTSLLIHSDLTMSSLSSDLRTKVNNTVYSNRDRNSIKITFNREDIELMISALELRISKSYNENVKEICRQIIDAINAQV